MGQERILIHFSLALTMPWVVPLSPPSKLTCRDKVGVPGQDHASLNNLTLAVGNDTV